MSSPLPFKKVAVLKGGFSAERAVSLVSGEMCAQALRNKGLDITEIDVQSDIATQLQTLKPDACFNALHGRWGEDGCIQGVLEILRIPYTHSGVLSSALAMDKRKSKEMYTRVGLRTPRSMTFDVNDVQLPPKPFVIKPVNEGSSVGIYIVRKGEDFDLSTLDPQRQWMAETYIAGRELTVSVLNDKALGITEIVPCNVWYDFNAKYKEGGSKHILPAALPANTTNRLLDMALVAHRALGCHAVSRSDFLYDGSEDPYILETNTQPGMTPTSLLPEQATYCGISFEDLCLDILGSARLHI